MKQRRRFLKELGPAGAGVVLGKRAFSIPPSRSGKGLRLGIISDLHHLQFGQNEEVRMKAFMDAVMHKGPDFIIQCGDFCRPEGSDGILREWNRFAGAKYHVLGFNWRGWRRIWRLR